MTISKYAYEELQSAVASIFDTPDLAHSLQDRLAEDSALASVISTHFDNDVKMCADFVKKHSLVRTRIVADVDVIQASVTAYFDVNKEVRPADVGEFIEEQFCFSDVESHDYVEVNVANAEIQYRYVMKDFETVSRIS